MIREASRRLGLRTWDKPAAACLASRIPYGTEVSVGLLSQVDRAEAALRRLGFARAARAPLRRHGAARGPGRRVSVRCWRSRGEVVAAVKACGYRYVTLDLEGFRSGNLNDGHATVALERGTTMKLSMMINYGGGFKEAAQRVVDLEKAGLDQVWIAEAYSFDAISQVGYLAARTERSRSAPASSTSTPAPRR